jgi:peroxiredoxin
MHAENPGTPESSEPAGRVQDEAMKSRWIAAVAAACAVGLLVVPWMLHNPSRASSGEVKPVPAHKPEGVANLDLTLTDMNGNDVKLADYRGKVILLNVWATWCGPCQAEIPELVEAYNKYKDQGVVVIGVSLDDTADTLREYAPKKQMNYPILLMRDEFDDAYGPILGVPISFFIGRDGKISRKHFGPVTKDDIDREIKALL